MPICRGGVGGRDAGGEPASCHPFAGLRPRGARRLRAHVSAGPRLVPAQAPRTDGTSCDELAPVGGPPKRVVAHSHYKMCRGSQNPVNKSTVHRGEQGALACSRCCGRTPPWRPTAFARNFARAHGGGQALSFGGTRTTMQREGAPTCGWAPRPNLTTRAVVRWNGGQRRPLRTAGRLWYRKGGNIEAWTSE